MSDDLALADHTPVDIWGREHFQRGLASLEGRHVVLVDAGLLDTGIADDMMTLVGGPVIPVAAGEPEIGRVQAVTDELRQQDAGVVVAIGGGSTLDTAKVAAAATRSALPVSAHMMSRERFPDPLLLIAIPTTAGSGAEVTKMAVVSDGGHKSWAFDEALRPAVAVLDPELTVTLPEAITVATGCDAFVHALEAGSGQLDRAPNRAAAIWAAGEIVEALPAVLTRPDDIDRRRRMQLAATAAGIGIDRCGTGIGHAIGHAIASQLTAPHGLLVMLGTLVAIDWGITEAPVQYEHVAAAIAPNAPVEELPHLVRDLADRVEYERHLVRYAAAAPLDGDVLAAELPLPVHRPMWSNNAAVPTPDDLTTLAHQTADEWTRIAAGA